MIKYVLRLLRLSELYAETSGLLHFRDQKRESVSSGALLLALPSLAPQLVFAGSEVPGVLEKFSGPEQLTCRCIADGG